MKWSPESFQGRLKDRESIFKTDGNFHAKPYVLPDQLHPESLYPLGSSGRPIFAVARPVRPAGRRSHRRSGKGRDVRLYPDRLWIKQSAGLVHRECPGQGDPKRLRSIPVHPPGILPGAGRLGDGGGHPSAKPGQPDYRDSGFSLLRKIHGRAQTGFGAAIHPVLHSVGAAPDHAGRGIQPFMLFLHGPSGNHLDPNRAV